MSLQDLVKVKSFSFISVILCATLPTEDTTEADESIIKFVPFSSEEVAANSTILFSISEDIEEHVSLENNSSKIEDAGFSKMIGNGEITLGKKEKDEKSEQKLNSRKNNFVSSLLAQGDPGLVRVLLDNSKPENLEVFLENSNITLDELNDFVEL